MNLNTLFDQVGAGKVRALELLSLEGGCGCR